MSEPSELRDHLVRTDEEFRRLAEQHRELDARLQDLASKPYLSESEQTEERTLKKRKLQLKDRMEEIVRRYRVASAPDSAATPAAPAAPSA
ncbi:MAG TPA: YdcH family protein [Vicinamibacterales bacterium]|nr:YdcH family protein [Vicinamibacterales bacterium]